MSPEIRITASSAALRRIGAPLSPLEDLQLGLPMKLRSLIREDNRLVPAEVEIILLPGLPQIHVLGLPGQVIRESLHRVRGALKSQGFEWPKAKQILVNIRPVDRRKSSRGLELALAAGILWETGQAAPLLESAEIYVYGELGLSGEVLEPEDLARGFRGTPGARLLTGEGTGPRPFACERIARLGDLDHPRTQEADLSAFAARRPEAGLRRRFTPSEARWLALTAVGEHHWLLAGAAGAGKSTLARALLSFLRAPSVEELLANDWRDGWRPLRAPHHSVGAKGMVGGGNDPRPGEVTRAHGGLLLLDELLEFPPPVQEALREPVESGFVDLSRSHHHARFPAKFTMIGTTNLCPCGRWVPGRPLGCAFSWRRCRSVLERISGPFFDRFEGLSFIEARREERAQSGEALLLEIETAQRFREERLRAGPSRIEVPPAFERNLDVPSERRRNALAGVARTLADLDQSVSPQQAHFEEAYEYTVRSFARLQQAEGV